MPSTPSRLAEPHQFALLHGSSVLDSSLRGSLSFQKEVHFSSEANKIKLVSLAPLFNAFLYNSPIWRLQPKADKAISPTFYDFLLIMISVSLPHSLKNNINNDAFSLSPTAC